jgi:eukaryotic-like serine/threonine-protein kinase
MNAAPLAAGQYLAPGYEAIEHLRRGRNLDVYDAWSEERRCRCVVKALRPDRLEREGPRARLLDEGRLLCSLTHPHIVRGYEVIAEPLPLVVMETLVGETLGYMVDREAQLTVEELAHLGIHLASAVGYLHAHDRLHLDLKPSNVIAEAGRAKLIDLSVARPPGPAHGGIGTFYYMAPEQVRGGVLGPPADVWGIGALLFEAATGEPAFDDPRGEGVDDPGGDDTWSSADGEYESSGASLDSGEPDTDVDEADYPQLTTRARRTDELRPGTRELAGLVAACLEPDPRRRPGVAGLAAALEPLAGIPPRERRHRAALG